MSEVNDISAQREGLIIMGLLRRPTDDGSDCKRCAGYGWLYPWAGAFVYGDAEESERKAMRCPKCKGAGVSDE